MQRAKWFEREFPPIEDNGLLPSIIERLAGTPARAAEFMKGINSEILGQRPENKWSIKEELGHLSDVEPLWLGRVSDLADKAVELRPADLTNQKTHEANHNATDINILLQRFRRQRGQLVDRLRNLSDEELLHSSLHPRLKTPMRAIDLAYFVAEHDDHHLVRMREIASLITSIDTEEPAIEYRKARLDDALKLSVLFRQVYIHTYGVDGVSDEFANFTTIKFSVDRIKERIRENPDSFFVAAYKNNLIGAAEIEYDRAAPVGNIKAPELSKLYILDWFTNRLAGTELLRLVEETLRKKNIGSYWLWVLVSNTRAISFYEKHGLQGVGNAFLKLEQNTYENKVMTKELIS